MLGRMATLRHTKTRRVRPVSARLLVGRSASAALRIDERYTSGEHATLVWTGGRWEIRDLGSRNGTYVDGRRLASGEAVVVGIGAKLGFGDPVDTWELFEAGPPAAVAEDLDKGTVRTAADGLLALPDEEHPEALVYADSTGRWVLEQDGETKILDGERVVTAGGVPWRVQVPAGQIGTATVNVAPTLDAVSVRFAVSRDEEHVQTTITFRGHETALEVREHWYAMLTLARKRLEDAGEPASEQGWIERDDLLRMLGVDSNTLNVSIYRARKQLQAAGIEGAAGIVEVRRGQRRIGIAASRLEVVPL